MCMEDVHAREVMSGEIMCDRPRGVNATSAKTNAAEATAAIKAKQEAAQKETQNKEAERKPPGKVWQRK